MQMSKLCTTLCKVGRTWKVNFRDLGTFPVFFSDVGLNLFGQGNIILDKEDSLVFRKS